MGIKRKNKIPIYQIALIALPVMAILGIFTAIIVESITSEVMEYSPYITFNEIMSSNKSAYTDDSGKFHDWIELHNSSSDPVDISGWRLSSSSYEEEYVFPENTMIGSNEYRVFFLTGNEESGVPFKLDKAGGETLTLKKPSGKKIHDKVTTVRLGTDEVMSRNAGRSWSLSDTCTPGFPNTEKGIEKYKEAMSRATDSLFISEIMAKNQMTIKDAYGKYSDWIELTNIGNEPLDLSDFYITDNIEDRFEFRLPGITLNPGEYIILFASGKDKAMKDGEIHLSFKLPESNTSVHLFNKTGVNIQSVTCDKLTDNESYAADDDGNFSITLFPTPGFPNTKEGYEEWMDSTAAPNGLVINEVMTSNTSYLPLNGKNYYDWIELYNASPETINLSDYYISTSDKAPLDFQLPDVSLKSGEYYVVIASGDTSLSGNKYAHAPFKLSASGEELYLSHADGTLADAVYLHDIPTNTTYGRTADGKGFFYLDKPTPAKANSKGIRQITSAPVPDVMQGIYNDIESLSVNLASEKGAKIYYTLDGSIPTKNSGVFSDALTLTETTVIRAVAYSEGKIPSSVETYSYIINEDHTFAVISLVSDPKNLWGEKTGIYIDGPGWTQSFPHYGANFWKDWERSANIELFEEDGSFGFSEGCGIKMFGHWGRAYPKKPFLVKFKEQYGASKLHYDLFGERLDYTEFNSFVLRAASQDQNRSRLRDEILTSLVGDGTDVLVQGYRPAVLYINGEYWGIYFIREKSGAELISHHLNVSEESVDLLYKVNTVEEGSNKEYNQLINYVETHDMSKDSCYQYVCERIDVLNFIDYKIAESYLSNTDMHNVRFYRSSEDDGKWRWLLYDLDYTFNNHSSAVRRLVEDMSYMPNVLLRSLLKNADFRKLYLERWSHHLQTTFSDERTLSYIDNMYNLVKDEMIRDCQRWNISYTTWEGEVNKLRTFLDGKNGVSWRKLLVKEIDNVLTLTSEERETYFSMIN